MTNSTWAPLHSALSPSSNPISLEWSANLKDGHREAIAAADLRRRVIHLHPNLKSDPEEQARILTHELFHFVWVRLGNPKRASWKAVLTAELARNARGELGWSSEWRKAELPRRFPNYACESFCDTAAWLHSGVTEHAEYTLAPRWRTRRQQWFETNLPPPWRA